MVIKNCDYQYLYELEPWCSTIYVDTFAEEYIEQEQPNTMFDLSERIYSIDYEKTNDIIIEFDVRDFTPEQHNLLANISEILANDDELETGSFELGIFKVTINKIKTYEEELIKCER